MTDDPRTSPRREFEPYINAALGRKAFDLVLLHVRELTSVADAFLICSGRSHRQVTAIGEYIKTDLKKHGVKPLSVEGMRDGQWVLLDYGDVIIHVFYEPVREFYDLEGLWMDAGRFEIESAPEETEFSDE